MPVAKKERMRAQSLGLLPLVPFLVLAFSAGCGGSSPPGGTGSALVSRDSGAPATGEKEADASPSLQGVDSAPPTPNAVDSGASADAGQVADGSVPEASTIDATTGDASDTTDGATDDACSCPDAGWQNSGTQGESAQGFGSQGGGGGQGQGGPPPGCPCGDNGGGFQGQQGATQGAVQGGGFQGAGGDGGPGFSRRHRARKPIATPSVHCVPLYPGSPWLSCH